MLRKSIPFLTPCYNMWTTHSVKSNIFILCPNKERGHVVSDAFIATVVLGICIKTVRGRSWFYLATTFNPRLKLIFAGKEVPDFRFFSIAFLIFLSKIYQNMGTLILVLRWNSRIETYTQKSFVAKYAKCEGTNIFLSQWHFCVK